MKPHRILHRIAFAKVNSFTLDLNEMGLAPENGAPLRDKCT